jgi:hypothetical protein
LAGSITCGIDDSKSVKAAGAEESPADGQAEADGDTEFAGGIARFSFGSSKQMGETEFAGGIARFNFGFGGH